ncbi:MAG: hypothetical protein ACLQBY_09335 [Solirubrobacteraceae bacterium]
MDPIHPISPGPPRISPAARLPVEPLERISRERDRPSRDAQQRKRRQPPPDPDPDRGEDDGEHPHIDVRV